MEKESIDTLSQQKVEEFCALTDRALALDVAIATTSQLHEHRHEAIYEAWDSVEHILRFPFDIHDDSHFTKIESSLRLKNDRESV